MDEETQTQELPRALTAEESALIRKLLEHRDFPGRDELLGQVLAKDGCLDQLEVYSFGEEPIESLPSPDRLSIR